MGDKGIGGLWSWAGRVTDVTAQKIGEATNVNGEQPPFSTHQELRDCVPVRSSVFFLPTRPALFIIRFA